VIIIVFAPEHRITALRQERLHRGHARQREELLIEAVEEPAERGDREDKPMVTGQAMPPATGRWSNRGGIHGEQTWGSSSGRSTGAKRKSKQERGKAGSTRISGGLTAGPAWLRG
jgi:hypothetical protein